MLTNRRRWISCFLTGATGLFFGQSKAVAQQDEPTLKEQLEFGLRARRPEEFAWIDMVVTKVNLGQLPQKLVVVSFNWARDQDDDYPYAYFVRALRILASRQGISLPPSG